MPLLISGRAEISPEWGMWRWAQWLDRATARVLGPAFFLRSAQGSPSGDAGTWSRLSPWCFCLDRTHGFSFSLLGEKPSPNPLETSASSAGAEPTPSCPCLCQEATETFQEDWQGGETGWGASCMDKNPLGSTPPPPTQRQGWLRGRETKIHATF